jgi:hypothetical protein
MQTGREHASRVALGPSEFPAIAEALLGEGACRAGRISRPRGWLCR